MSNYPGRSKALKRRFSGDEDGSSKRTRAERPPKNPSSNNNGRLPTKNLAANRLATLRQDIKRTVSAVPSETDAITVTRVEGSKNIKVRVDSNRPNTIGNVQDQNSYGKSFGRKPSNIRITKTVNNQGNLINKSCSLSEVKQHNISSRSVASATQNVKSSDSKGKHKEVPSTSLCTTKYSSVNDRLKRARQKSSHKNVNDDDDDTIIVIDDSFDSTLNKYVTKDLLNKSDGAVRSRIEQVQRSRRSTNDSLGLSKSFIVVSVAADSDERSITKSPGNHRLSTFNSSPSSSSKSSSTLTPGINERSPEVSQKSIPKVLRVPLKRNFFKRTLVSNEKKIENCVKEVQDASTGIKRDFGTQISRETLKDNIFSTKLQGTFNRDMSETRSEFGSQISSKIFKREASIKEDNIFSTNKTFNREVTESRKNFESQISPQASSKNDNIFATSFQGTSSKDDTEIRRHFDTDREYLIKKDNIFSTINRDATEIRKDFGDQLSSKTIIKRNNIFSKEATDSRSDFGAKISPQIFKKLSPISKDTIESTYEDDEPGTNNNVSSPKLVKIIRSPTTKVQQSSLNIFKPDSNKSKFENKAKSSLADRLIRIKNQTSATSAKNLTLTVHNRNSTEQVFNNVMDTESTQKNPSQEVVRTGEPLNWLQSTAIPKTVMIENWIDPRPSVSDETISDSMLVNIDDTLFNRSVLMTEQQEDVSMEWDSYPEPSEINVASGTTTSRNVQRENVVCLVADTNVFMHDLPRLRDLVNIRDTGNQKIKIYVPWMVLQELDHLKDQGSSSSRTPALTAQKFINKQLEQPEPKIIGQSVHDVSEQMNIGKSPDDKILSCCLQAGTKFQSVILLSNDINLRNKALTNNVKTYAPKEILGKLKGTKSLKIKVRLQNLLSQIIYKCCEEAYGDACSRMDMLQDCPWSFAGCLKRFKRYWSAVFKQLLLKQCLKVIEELISFTEKGEIDDSDPKILKKFRDKVKEFLFYLQDIDQYREAIKRVRDEIDSIVEAPSALCDL